MIASSQPSSTYGSHATDATAGHRVVDAAPAAAPAATAPSSSVKVKAPLVCVCGGGEDGATIKCGICGTRQHAICYGVFPEYRERVEGHICFSCYQANQAERREEEEDEVMSSGKRKRKNKGKGAVGGKRPKTTPKMTTILLDPTMEERTPTELKCMALLRRTLLGISYKKVKVGEGRSEGKRVPRGCQRFS